MKRLQISLDPIEVYDVCVSGVRDELLACRLQGARVEMLEAFRSYNALASMNQLFTLPRSAWGHGEQLVIATMTKEELVDLYSTYMAGRGTPGRSYYDRLMTQTPHTKCPYCGFGQVSTLDHFLSKALYPAFSVLCTNLVPACVDCNGGRGAMEAREECQILHPYFEEPRIEQDVWLFAEIIESTPVSVRFYVAPPAAWAEDLALRTHNHFREFGLARRFSIEAASELAELADLLTLLGTPEERNQQLTQKALVERGSSRRNSWKAALYESLAASVWYQIEGYRQMATQFA
ncbi:MAG: hypothetical protein QM776_03605 [Rhodocyclaceae bacterium]